MVVVGGAAVVKVVIDGEMEVMVGVVVGWWCADGGDGGNGWSGRGG